MKTLLTVLSILAIGSLAEASKDRGGGDLCEKRILEVADDISAWIKADGAQELKLPADVNLEQYTSGMTTAIDNARVRCVKNGDEGYPIRVGNTPKVCRFDRTETEQLITCDFETFMNKALTNESDQYALVHHEYAGLAGVENPNGEQSTYDLSAQITDFLEDITTKKLAVKPAKEKPTPIHPACTIKSMQTPIEAGIKAYLEYTFESIYGGYPKLDIDKTSISVVYRGLLDFKDYSFLPNKGVQKEHAFDVTFKSLKGTEFNIVTLAGGLYDKTPALNAIFSIPELAVEKQFDSEGNYKGLKCVAKTNRGYNRSALFMNTSSGKLFKDDLISHSYGTLAEKDIE